MEVKKKCPNCKHPFQYTYTYTNKFTIIPKFLKCEKCNKKFWIRLCRNCLSIIVRNETIYCRKCKKLHCKFCICQKEIEKYESQTKDKEK